jgi:hypothetical protein
MTILGFTGTRDGMTERQRKTVESWMTLLPLGPLHHGDCVGADAEAHAIARQQRRAIILHPPDIKRHRAFCQDSVKEHEPEPYLERNKSIVIACEVLIAAPGGNNEVKRSGTWSTVRYARTAHRPIIVAFPHGGWRVEYDERQMTFEEAFSLLCER